MKSVVEKYIESKNLLKKDSKYIVALSGGADSVALLVLLYDLGYNIEAAHCNFHLRGEESDRDEAFCQKLCERLSVAFNKTDFNTVEYAELNGLSIEMAARELRYEWFGKLCNNKNADGICVAHHKDDSAETILINLIRGTGINGLTGIKPCSRLNNHSDVSILRPLLCVGRKEITDYLASIGQDYITDSTNLKDDVVRNKLRLNIIPQLKAINPKAVENILRTAENLSETIDNTKENRLFELLKGYGFNGKQVRQIADNNTTGKIFRSKDFTLLVDRGRMIIEHRSDDNDNENDNDNGNEKSKNRKIEKNPSTLPSTGSGQANHKPSTITPHLIIEREEITEGYIVPKQKEIACLDAAKVEMPLTLRIVQSGDKFIPFGMKGKKLVSDYLTDIKMPLTEKQRQLVVCDNSGNIVWLVNQRPDNRYRVTSTTKSVLLLHIQH